jgi:hypothetical protein
VTLVEFKRVMARTSHLSDQAIQDMVKKADVDNDGLVIFFLVVAVLRLFVFRCVNFKEFAKMMS